MASFQTYTTRSLQEERQKHTSKGLLKRMTGCFKAAGMSVGSDLRVGEWRKSCSFLLCFQSSIRASRGTIGGYFLAGRSMTWWPVSEMHPSVFHGLKVILYLRRAGLLWGSHPYTFCAPETKRIHQKSSQATLPVSCNIVLPDQKDSSASSVVSRL